ncbi:meiotic Sister-Chromatid recombination aldehyde dehydrogenase [Kwoniella heveanensis BCC8398]|uniref:Meiotic Sister-Chromatid recombination aldehyde dehydrogenase n=1 Tax=Kwoniella heveanensis BCC8398 TaxID=1296120 RepID=A0A1B9GTP1_9TREE|nr:meiotic Sister-Chromatid recombination aldehyde dehydrogenase [Kwoniella heveanensis BCC8398]
MLEEIDSLPDFLQPWATWLSALTLGQIWSHIYNPPNRFNLTIAFLVISLKLPSYLKRFRSWRDSRKVIDFAWPVPKEADKSWTGRVIKKPSLFSHLDDNTLLPPEAGKTGEKRKHITCYDPSTAYHLTTLPLLTADEIASNIERADVAQKKWSQTSFAQRISFLRSIKAWVLRDMEGIVKVACRDTGKTEVDAVFGEILTTLSKLDWLIKHGEKTISPDARAGNLLLAHKVSKVHYAPLGTVLACVSWNYSFHNALSPILAALFAGNTIVVKCSEQVAWSTMWFIGGVKACLRACGLDEDVVQLVVCLPEIAEMVTRNKRIKHITFIGSEPVGRKVAVAAAELMVPTCIELGGKDPAFIMPGADLDFFASTWLRGAFQSAGQNCIGVELFLVHRSQYDRFVSIVMPRVRALRPGQDVGSLISHTPIRKLESILQSAVNAGAKLLAGGKQYTHPDHPQAAYFEPTLIVDVKMDMEIANEELFAPVMTVVPYDDVDEAVEWLNRSRYGLGAGVYGRDRTQCRKVAEKLQCGMVAINDFGVFYLNQAMPFGGVKASGHGRFGGEEGLRSLCSAKSITEDRFFSYIRTSIPKPVDFPLPDGKKPWNFLVGLVNLAYARTLWGQVKGLGGLIGASM